MKKNGIIFHIQRFCVHDGPGIRTTVFFKGCPLSCIWCHNPESKQPQVQISYSERSCLQCRECEAVCKNGVHSFSSGAHRVDGSRCAACGRCVEACPALALELIGQRMSVEEVMEEILKDRDYYGASHGGVTLSGGEPLFQPDFCLELLRACKECGLHTCVETSGFCQPSILEQLAEFIDLFLFDFKEGDSRRHLSYTSVPNEPILRNLRLLDSRGASVILRCPVIPGLNDREEQFQSIADYARLSCVKSVELMAYHTMGREKAKKIGADYPLQTPPASQFQISCWREKLEALGCEKLSGL